ncbi:unnamed protein product [Arctogadus glacialis]
MAGYQRCIFLALACLLLCHDSLEVKAIEGSNNEYHKFLSRHMPKNAPTSANADEWLKFLGPNGFARNENKRSFLNDIKKVKAVCTSQGGLQYNSAVKLCISRKKFHFIRVTKTSSKKGNPYTPLKVYKHLILACEDGLPIHFEANGGGHTPEHTSLGCGGGKAE